MTVYLAKAVVVTDIWVQRWTEMWRIWAECIMNTPLYRRGLLCWERDREGWFYCIKHRTHTHTHTHLHSRPQTQTHSCECQEFFRSENWLIFPSLAESFASSWDLWRLLHLRAGRWGCVLRNIMKSLISRLIFPSLRLQVGCSWRHLFLEAAPLTYGAICFCIIS